MTTKRVLGRTQDHSRNALDIAAALGGLKGPIMKVAQLLATIPDAVPSTLGLPFSFHSITVQLSAPAAAEKCVAANALVARAPADTALPALNPNHPNQSKPAPIIVRGRLWGGIGSRP